MPEGWVDFKLIKEAVTMYMVLDHYQIEDLEQKGDELRGRCPIHGGSAAKKHFSVNLSKNAFKCFYGNCAAHGNILDFVAAKEHCSVRDAALKLRDWFKVGDSVAADEEVESIRSLTTEQIESLKRLSAELDTHASRIAYHSSQAEIKIAAVKEIVATLD